MATTNFLLVNHTIQVEINTTPTAAQPTWVAFGDGIENLTEALNEVVQQYFFFSGGGFAQNYVTGMAPTYTVTGHRIVGDPALDWIFSPERKFGLMTQRNTQLRLSVAQADGSTEQITAPITLANLTDLGGATTDGAAISFEMRINGQPTLTNTPA